MLKNLTLVIPTELDILNDCDCVEQILPSHGYMVYWKAQDGSFKKTSKFTPVGESIIRSLNREINISEHLNGVSSPYINIPKWYKTNTGTPVITQKYLEGGDLFTYLLDNPSKRLEIARIYLKCIREILPVLYEQKIYFGDFSLENFMVEKDDEGKLKRIILIDFGQAEIYMDNKITTWKPQDYQNVRQYLIHPDIFGTYGKEEIMSNQDKYDRLFKKDLFVLGVILYMIITGEELWDPYLTGKKFTPEEKVKILTDFRSLSEELVTNKKMSNSERLILTILHKLLNPRLDEIISISELLVLIDLLSEINTKKRMLFSEDDICSKSKKHRKM